MYSSMKIVHEGQTRFIMQTKADVTEPNNAVPDNSLVQRQIFTMH